MVQGQKSVDVNSFRSIFSALYIGVVGPSVFIIQPGFVQGLVDNLKFSESQSGYIASAEMWGIAIATLVMGFLSRRFSWRKICTLSILVIVIGNILSSMVSSAGLFAVMRFITGLGSGGLFFMSYMVIGQTGRPERNFGLQIMLLLSYGAVGLMVLPSVLATFGMKGILAFLAAFAVSALPFIGNLPSAAIGKGDRANPISSPLLPMTSVVLAVAGMFVYFLAQGIVWGYLFLIGTHGGMGEQAVANALTFSQFLGIAGGLAAAVTGAWLGGFPALLGGIAATIIPLFFILGAFSPEVYFGSVSVFNFASNMSTPLMLAAMTRLDVQGRLVAFGVAAEMLGLAIGPAVAALVLDFSGYTLVVGLGMALFLCTIPLVLIPLLRRQNTIPAGQALP